MLYNRLAPFSPKWMPNDAHLYLGFLVVLICSRISREIIAKIDQILLKMACICTDFGYFTLKFCTVNRKLEIVLVFFSKKYTQIQLCIIQRPI